MVVVSYALSYSLLSIFPKCCYSNVELVLWLHNVFMVVYLSSFEHKIAKIRHEKKEEEKRMEKTQQPSTESKYGFYSGSSNTIIYIFPIHGWYVHFLSVGSCSYTIPIQYISAKRIWRVSLHIAHICAYSFIFFCFLSKDRTTKK